MVIDRTLLGLLAIEPRHGYGLSREFADDSVLGDIVHLEPGLLYANLKKLEKNGLIEAHLEHQQSRPPRRVFEVTSSGREELNQWLQTPVEKTRDIRLEFLLKFWIARQFQPETIQDLLQSQQDVCEQFIHSLEEQISLEEDEFHQLVLAMRLAQNQALLRWLQRLRAAEAQL